MRKFDPYRIYLLFEGGQAFFFGLVFTVNMVYQATTAHLTPLQLILVGTVLEGAVFLFEVPTGVVADMYSRRASIVLGVFLIGCGFLLEGSRPVFATILLAQLLWGVGYTFTSGAVQAWISDEIGEQKANRAFLRGNQAGQLGKLLAIPSSVALASARLNIPILAGGGGFILLAGFLTLFMPEEGFKPTPKIERNTWRHMGETFYNGIAIIRLRSTLLMILGIGLFYGLYSEGFDRLWTKLLLDNFTFPTLGALKPVVWFGVIDAVGIVFSALAVEIIRRRVDMSNLVAMLRGLLAITAGLVIGLWFFAASASFVGALAALWWISTMRCSQSPIYTALVNQRLDPHVRATVLSMSSQVDAIGQISTGPLIGLVGQFASVRTAIAATGIILSPAVGLCLAAEQGMKTREAQSRN